MRNLDSEENAFPRHLVWLDSYSISEVPVTREEWGYFLESSRYEWNASAELEHVCPTMQHPIVFVSWFDCQAYCEWLSKEYSRTIRLPTEAEWERACRGVIGQYSPNADKSAYDWLEWVKRQGELLRPVGANPSIRSGGGCLDMWENVREWCLDWYAQEEYKNHSDNTRNPAGPSAGEYKVFRGGNPLCSGTPCCAYRGFDNPNVSDHTTGFRIVQKKEQP